jgi:flavin-dependent dehydrogenase
LIRDVAIVGCGPAGSATAVALAQRGRSVVVFEQSDFTAPRVGETLGGEIQPLLRALGAWEALVASAPLPFGVVRSAWGGPELVERLSITHPFGSGFHVDRARFDALLARIAEQAGAEIRIATGRCAVEPVAQGFRVQPARGAAVQARFLVDASGRGAPGTAALKGGRRWLSCDRMVGLVGQLRPPGPPDTDLLIEATEDGWWYSAPQPGGAVVVVLMTDADLIPAGRHDAPSAFWRAALQRARHTTERCGGAAPERPVRIVRADSGCLLPDRAAAFCAVGDAARSSDPLAGQGVGSALRSGINAAEAIDRALSDATLDASSSTASLTSDLDRGADYYRLEKRWSESLFWSRRRPTDWKRAPLTLTPTTCLHWAGRPSGRDALAPVEALLPRRAIAAVLDLLRTPQHAHVAMRALRDHAPLPDRRLLVGLQALVERAPLERVPPA